MAETVRARGPGRVNLIGEHTDYNAGLALPFAIDRGVTVTAEPLDGDRIEAHALDLGESDEFALAAPERATGWRAFVRGAVAELQAAGHELRPVRLTIESDLEQGAGLSSSAALETALCLALLGEEPADRVELAKLCSRVENDWVGAETGLLDQLAALFSDPGHAVRIDFDSLEIEPVRARARGLDADHARLGGDPHARRVRLQRAPARVPRRLRRPRRQLAARGHGDRRPARAAARPRPPRADRERPRRRHDRGAARR